MNVLPLTLAALVATPALASAHQTRDGKHRHDRHDRDDGFERDGRRGLRAHADDHHDLRRLRDIQRDWRRAVRRGDHVAERVADHRLKVWLHHEIVETRHEVVRSRAHRWERRGRRGGEARRARNELRRLRRAARRLEAMQADFDRGWASRRQYRAKRRLIRDLVDAEARGLGRGPVRHVRDDDVSDSPRRRGRPARRDRW